MKRISSLALSLVLIFSSCSSSNTLTKKENFYVSGDGQYRTFSSINEPFLKDIEKLQMKIEENLVWRREALNFLAEVKETDILTSEQLVKIHEDGAEKYKSFAEFYSKYVKASEWMVGKDAKIIFRPGKKSELISKRYTRKSGKREIEYIKKYLYLNPFDEGGAIKIKQIKMSLASAVTLYDNYLVVISKYQKMKKLRHLINYDNASLKNPLRKITKDFNKIQNYRKLNKAIKFYETVRKFEKETTMELDQSTQYLDTLIHSSITYNSYRQKIKKKMWKRKFKTYGAFLVDYFKEALRNIMNEGSKIFGNTAGLVQTRKGKLYKWSDEKLESIAKTFKPLDVLLEKTPFRLTDKFIPGHYGHVAIWTGTEEELKTLGLWEHPIIKPYQEEVRKGKRIIEALRPGVQYNTLRHFMDIDDLAVIRNPNLSVEKQKRYLVNAFKQVGKKYDFNFNVETDEKIVCSELAYVTFDDIPWPTELTLGRYNISPDHVASKVTETGDFKMHYLVYDGKEINKDLELNFKRLLDGDYKEVKFD